MPAAGQVWRKNTDAKKLSPRLKSDGDEPLACDALDTYKAVNRVNTHFEIVFDIIN